MPTETFISAILLMESRHIDLQKIIRQLSAFLSRQYSDHEIILADISPVLNHDFPLEPLLEDLPSLRYLRLVSTLSSDAALATSIENTIGDYVIIFDAINDPIEIIKSAVDLCAAGNDVVIGVAAYQQTMLYRLARPFIGWVLRIIDYRLPKNATNFRCLSRAAVNAVTSIGRFHQQFYVRISNLSYKAVILPYTLKSDAKPRTIWQAIRKSTQLLIFNSTRPLRWISALGFSGSMLAFLFALYSIVIRFARNGVVEGWTSMVLFMSILNMIMFLILAIMGEYLIRILDEQSEKQDYAIAYEKHSAVMLDKNRYNVMVEGASVPNIDREF